MKHHEFTLFKKEVGNSIIRMMFLPLMPDTYKKLTGSKRFLVVRYLVKDDKEIPRKRLQTKSGDRKKFIKCWTDKWWFDNGKKAADKFNSL